MTRVLYNFTPVLALAVVFIAPSIRAGTIYNFQTLNNSGDPAFNQLLGIDNAGTIAGYFGDGTVLPNKGYTLTPPSSYTNENFPESIQTQVVGINSNAAPTTVGFWVDGTGNNLGFVDQSGTFTSVSDPLTPATGTVVNQLLGVNNNDIAAGFYNNAAGAANGYLYNIGTPGFTAINFPGATATTATGINNAGDVSGFYIDGAGLTHGFLDIGGVYTSYDDPNGETTMFFGLNNENQVVGSYLDGSEESQGLLYNFVTNTWQTISDPNAVRLPLAFGTNGTILNGINDRGDLVGFYSDGKNIDGLLATPVPEPGSFGLVSVAMLLALGLGWKKSRTA